MQVRAIVALSIFLMGGFGSLLKATSEDLTDQTSTTAANPIEDRQRSFDQATAPIRFQSQRSDWQLVPAGESCSLQVRIDALPQRANQDVTLIYQLLRVGDDQVIDRRRFELTLSDSGQSKFVELAAQSPTAPGIYEIRCRVNAKPDRLWSRLQWSRELLANTRVPLVVIEQASALHASDATSKTSNANEMPILRPTRWTTVANVGRISQEDWMAPAWIPGAANRIVPNVRRVGESLTLNPWRDRSELEPTQLAPTESYVGALTDLVPHQPFQLAIALDLTAAGIRKHPIQVDFSDSPKFDAISRSVELVLQRSPDVDHADSTLDWARLLFFPKAESEFVRITNAAPDRSIMIRSVQLDQTDDASGHDTSIPITRPVDLHVTSADCLKWLTADYDDIAEQRGYADSTANLLRRFKLIERMEVHAKWLGYDRIQLVGDSALVEAFSDNAVATAPWERALLDSATRNWLANQPICAAKPPAPKRVSKSASGAASIPWPDWRLHQYPFRYQILKTLTDLNSSRLSLTSSTLPQWVMRRDQAVLNEYRGTPFQFDPNRNTPNPENQLTHLWSHTSSVDAATTTSTRTQLTVINMAPWASVATLHMHSTNFKTWNWMDDVSDEVVVTDASDSDRWSIQLPPHAMVNLWIESDKPKIKSWRPAMADPAQTLQRVKRQVAQVVDRIGSLALPPQSQILGNGGFEVSGRVGIVGWMHTQFPSTAVVLDDTDAIEGKHSIRMTANESTVDQPWLVSETIAVPESGRLAISMATRAISMGSTDLNQDPVQPASGTLPLDARQRRRGSIMQTSKQSNQTDQHRIRVALEGNRKGTPIRLATDLSVPRNGKWTPRRLVLENDQLKHGDFDSLRLTVDSLSHGRIWIDDVQLHDHFATAAERSKLQGMGFLAVQGLQQGNLKPAATLLSNSWSLHLVCSPAHPIVRSEENSSSADRVSSDAIPADSAKQPSSRSESTEDSNEPESVARRLRDWLPKPIRF